MLMFHSHTLKVLTVLFSLLCFTFLLQAAPKKRKSKVDRESWRQYAGKAGYTGWRCHVIQPDPRDWGPDGINTHDFDGDGHMDVLVNFEEGALSRLYFNPGLKDMRKPWEDYLEFKHGQCEDSGIGDLNNDGLMDYIANGGWVYFNPGNSDVRDAAKWRMLTFFDREHRIPLVMDMDGDGLNDLVTRGATWFKQPKAGKYDMTNWQRIEFTNTKWPMMMKYHDMDLDGKKDFVIQDRRDSLFYVKGSKDYKQKKYHLIVHGGDAMFMTIADFNGDGLDDIALCCNKKDRKYQHRVLILLRKNRHGHPDYKLIELDVPMGARDKLSDPKGIAYFDLNLDGEKELLVMSELEGRIWYYTLNGAAEKKESWKISLLDIPGAHTRKKMDNAYLCDLDGDGDQDFLTTEENGGWGVIWFENPSMK